MDLISEADFTAVPGTDGWQVLDAMAAAYFDSRDFASGAALVARIAELADAADHHPDVDLRYRGVTVRTVTHSAGGLTRKDAELAAAISRAAGELGIVADTERLRPRGSV